MGLSLILGKKFESDALQQVLVYVYHVRSFALKSPLIDVVCCSNLPVLIMEIEILLTGL